MTEPGTQVQRWADDAMYAAAPMELDHDEFGNIIPRVRLLWMTPDPLGAIAAMCRMYKGIPTYGLSDVGDDERMDYLTQVQKTHLQAPLEAVQLHFFIEGVTRSFTHQMVRQRTAVYAQESLRFAVKEEPFTDITSLPPSLAATQFVPEEERHGYMPADDQAQRNRDVWDTCVAHIDEAYHYLVDHGMPAEDARGLIHHAITTRLNYNTNLRNLKEHAGNRLCTQAQFEWRLVFMGIVKEIREYWRKMAQEDWRQVMGSGPWTAAMDTNAYENYGGWQFEALADSGLFRPICYQLGACGFKANFDRACSIRERVDQFEAAGVGSEEWSAGTFGKDDPAAGIPAINPAEWLLDPGAARNTSGGAGH